MSALINTSFDNNLLGIDDILRESGEEFPGRSGH